LKENSRTVQKGEIQMLTRRKRIEMYQLSKIDVQLQEKEGEKIN